MIPVYRIAVYSHEVTIIAEDLQGRVNRVLGLLIQQDGTLGSVIGVLLLGHLGARSTLGVTKGAGHLRSFR